MNGHQLTLTPDQQRELRDLIRSEAVSDVADDGALLYAVLTLLQTWLPDPGFRHEAIAATLRELGITAMAPSTAYVTITQAMHRLGCSALTVRCMVADGRLAGFTVNDAVLVSAESIDTHLSRKEVH